jgi:hypothetical protein
MPHLAFAQGRNHDDRQAGWRARLERVRKSFVPRDFTFGFTLIEGGLGYRLSFRFTGHGARVTFVLRVLETVHQPANDLK